MVSTRDADESYRTQSRPGSLILTLNDRDYVPCQTAQHIKAGRVKQSLHCRPVGAEQRRVDRHLRNIFFQKNVMLFWSLGTVYISVTKDNYPHFYLDFFCVQIWLIFGHFRYL